MGQVPYNYNSNVIFQLWTDSSIELCQYVSHICCATLTNARELNGKSAYRDL